MILGHATLTVQKSFPMADTRIPGESGQAQNRGFLGKSRQLHQIVVRYGFDGLPSFAPGGETTGDDKRVEAFFPQ